MDFSNLIADRMLEVKASAVREIFKVASQPGVITLAGGNPAPESFPAEEIKEAAMAILTQQPSVALQYNLSEGYPRLREQLANRMEKKFGIDMSKNELIVVSGSQQGADLTTKALVNEGDGVICEEPSFIGCLNTFRTYKAKLYGVRMNDDGMDMEMLEETLKNNKNIKLIYTIPTFLNP
ncbi:MAG: PLP-dependent aminotransferase family protein, partial [Clostridia bacterium]|nr:PLP-dependent aminotransferase family protein [Clostridia bacterium]